MKRNYIYIYLFMVLAACKNETAVNDNSIDISSSIKPPEAISYNIVAKYPHNDQSYTQGLIWQNGYFIEGTGIEGESKLMKVDLKSGNIIGKKIEMPSNVFGEGVTVLQGKVYQLSWQNKKVFVYDEKSLTKIQELYWPHEGWGITSNGKDLIISTGGSNIYFVQPETLQVLKTIEVQDNNGPVGNLNELEFIDGYVYANIYLTDYIVKIDPNNGIIKGKMDFTGLLEKFGSQVNKEQGLVLNGIAYDNIKKVMFITGKKWPLLFEIKLN